MSASLALRIVAAFGLLVNACSQGAREPVPVSPGGQAGAATQGGSSPQKSSSGGASQAGASATSSESGVVGIPAAGAPESEAGAPNSGGLTGAGGNVPTAVTWKVIAESTDGNLYASTPAAASRGADAAVAYVEQIDTTPATARVVMQRFDATAERVGPLLEIGSDPDQQSNVALASDGKQYAACWDSSLEVHCSLVDDQGEAQLNVLELPGQYPTIVASRSGWVIAYTTSDTMLRLQPLTAGLELTGTSVDLKRSARFAYPKVAALLTGTPSGFALVGAGLDDGHDGLLRLGADLQPVGPAVPLGRDFWFYGQLIASDTRAAVSLSAPYGSYLVLMDTEQVTGELLLAGGGKTGMDEAFLLTDGGIGAAWLTPNSDVLRRFLANGHDAELGLGSRQTEVLLGLPEEGTDSYQQLLRVADQTLLVGRARRYGYLGPGAIRAAALSFP